MALCLVCAGTPAIAQQISMCRHLCGSEKVQCVKAIVQPGWLESARMFLDKHSSLFRPRQDNGSDSGSWLQQRQDQLSQDKNNALEQKQQCDNGYLQCTLACADPAGSAVPQTTPFNPSITPQ